MTQFFSSAVLMVVVMVVLMAMDRGGLETAMETDKKQRRLGRGAERRRAEAATSRRNIEATSSRRQHMACANMFLVRLARLAVTTINPSQVSQSLPVGWTGRSHAPLDHRPAYLVLASLPWMSSESTVKGKNPPPTPPRNGGPPRFK